MSVTCRFRPALLPIRIKLRSWNRILQTLKSDNDALEARISTYVDLKHIYEVATGELGMVYPSDDQILYYDKTESGYVRQYEDIPTD